VAGMFDDDEPSTDLDSFAEAVAWWRAKVHVEAAVFKAMSAEQRARAFTVADVTDLEVVGKVWEAIDVALEHGVTLDAFKKSMRETLAGFEERRLDVIFRTNLQSAYSAGRQAQQTNPAVLKAFPYWQFVAVLDRRTSTICRACEGTILPATSPWWQDHQPPLHHNCRSTVRALEVDEALAAGVSPIGPAVEPRAGFGVPLQEYDPDLSSFPPELRNARDSKR
jgi:SPP1 gp7 family putative phage head morphogenesis protein